MKMKLKLLELAAQRWIRLHRNQKGMETLQVVLILAVSAVILSILVRIWPEVFDFVWFHISMLIIMEE